MAQASKHTKLSLQTPCTSWECSQSGGQNKIIFLFWEMRSILMLKNLLVLSSRLTAFPQTCKESIVHVYVATATVVTIVIV